MLFFWSIGALLAEDIKQYGIPGELMLTLYGIPALFMGMFATIIEKHVGKKRGAFLTGIGAGFMLSLFAFFDQWHITFGLTFLTALFVSLGWPLLNGTFADYVHRLDGLGNSLVGLQGSAISMSYIVGPTLAGFLADSIGNRNAFSVLGAFLVTISLVGLLFIPRKIKMPQKELILLEDL